MLYRVETCSEKEMDTDDPQSFGNAGCVRGSTDTFMNPDKLDVLKHHVSSYVLN